MQQSQAGVGFKSIAINIFLLKFSESVMSHEFNKKKRVSR